MNESLFLAVGDYGGAGFFGSISLILLGLIVVIVPIVIMSQLHGIQKRLEASFQILGKTCDLIQKGNHSNMGSEIELLRELKIQNKLTRQLLKAYGHEPEA